MSVVKVRGDSCPGPTAFTFIKLQGQAEQIYSNTETTWQVSLYSPAWAEMFSHRITE